MVACFAMGMDALLTWDDVFDSRQKRHESGIREHGLLQAGSPSVVVRKVLQAREIQGSSSKTPVTKPDGTKMFRSVFLNDARRCCFFLPT